MILIKWQHNVIFYFFSGEINYFWMSQYTSPPNHANNVLKDLPISVSDDWSSFITKRFMIFRYTEKCTLPRALIFIVMSQRSELWKYSSQFSEYENVNISRMEHNFSIIWIKKLNRASKTTFSKVIIF